MAKSRSFCGGPHWPRAMHVSNAPALASTGTLAAAGDRIAFIGTVCADDGASHDYNTLYWRCLTAGGSYTVRIGFRDVDAATGPPGRDDGTVDQSATHVNPASNTNLTSTLDAARTLAHGAQIAVVVDFSAYTSGTFQVAGINSSVSSYRPGTSTFIASAWAAVTATLPLLTLYDSVSGHYAVLDGSICSVSAAVTATAFNNASAADEEAFAFTVSAPWWGCQVGFLVNAAAGADFDVVLYEGTTAKGTFSLDSNTWPADAVNRWVEVSFPDVALTVGNTYYLAIKPGTANNVTIYKLTTPNAGSLIAFANALGSTIGHATRVDAGAWSAVTTTILPVAYVRAGAIDDGASSGGVVGRGLNRAAAY